MRWNQLDIYIKSMVHIFLMNFPSDEMTSAWCSPTGKGAAHEWQLKILCNTIQILSSCWHLLKIARCHDDVLQLPRMKMERGRCRTLLMTNLSLKTIENSVQQTTNSLQLKKYQDVPTMCCRKGRGEEGANHYQQAAIPPRSFVFKRCPNASSR